VTFVATRCSDACPIANAAFYKLAERLRRDRVDAQLLTVTLDPAYDTPYVMSTSARRFRALAPSWRFASGRVADVRRLMASLGVVARPDKHGVPEEHSSFVYLLDEHVRLAKTFLLSSDLADQGERALRESRVASHVSSSS
jgi:cytochrome oxidase Cu insertion factor (SCO1/SenC/PrrC family)